MLNIANYHYAEGNYAECHCAECHYAVCRGALLHFVDQVLIYVSIFLQRSDIQYDDTQHNDV